MTLPIEAAVTDSPSNEKNNESKSDRHRRNRLSGEYTAFGTRNWSLPMSTPKADEMHFDLKALDLHDIMAGTSGNASE